MERLQLKEGETEVSSSVYNAIIGAVILYGFIIDALIVNVFSGKAYELFVGNVSSMGALKGMLVFACIGYFVCCIVGALLVHKSNNPVVSFIGFNFFAIPIGFMLAFFTIPFYSSTVVVRAFVLTAVITGVMLVVSTIIPQAFAGMGKTLMISLLICIIVDIIAMFMGQDLVIIDYAVTFIFSLFIGYDWAKANACAKTVDNAIDNAAELYLDIINLFIRILSILGRND